MWPSLRTPLALIFGLLLLACGGGGGGGSTDPGFSATPTTLTFSTVQGTTASSQDVTLTVTNAKASYVGAQWKGATPAWCTVTINGSGQHFDMNVYCWDPSLVPGTYTATLTAGIADTNGAILATTDIHISYTISARFGASPGALTFSYIQGSALPAAQELTLSGAGRTWQVLGSQPWIKLGASSGTAPSTLVVTADPTGMGVGTYQGSLTLLSGTDRILVPVTLTVGTPAILVDKASLTFGGINGAPQAAQTLGLGLNTGGGSAWNAVSSVSWLVLDRSSGTFPGTLSVAVDPSRGPLASGSHDATVTVTSGGLTLTVPVSLVLAKPTFVFSPDSLVLGGTDGRDFSAQPLQVGLNTGSAPYAFTAGTAQGWITPSATTGTASATPSSLTVTPNLVGQSGGTQSGSLVFHATINGDEITGTLPVTLNLESHRILATDTGVAFTSVPGLSSLTRTLKVCDNLGLPTSWNAASSQPWLTVSPSGAAGGDLVLTADPAGLPLNQISYATVTVTGTDPSLQGPERIQVGFWIGDSTPAALSQAGTSYLDAAMDPIRPYAYLANGAGSVKVLNLYTNAVVASIDVAGATLTQVTVSLDGTTLYATDATHNQVVPVDLATYQVGTAWSTGSTFAPALAFARCNGKDLVLGGNGAIYDAAGGALLSPAWWGISGQTYKVAAPITGDRVAVADMVQTLAWSSMHGGQVTVGRIAYCSAGGSNSQDWAFNADGTRFYGAWADQYQFYQFDTNTGTGNLMPCTRILPGNAYPRAVTVAKDGRAFCVNQGASFDLWVYAPDGTQLARKTLMAPTDILYPVQVRVSGDGLRVLHRFMENGGFSAPYTYSLVVDTQAP